MLTETRKGLNRFEELDAHWTIGCPTPVLPQWWTTAQSRKLNSLNSKALKLRCPAMMAPWNPRWYLGQIFCHTLRIFCVAIARLALPYLLGLTWFWEVVTPPHMRVAICSTCHSETESDLSRDALQGFTLLINSHKSFVFASSSVDSKFTY